jgi:murein DD-endopeptidase MepM/ murein hydrolase activator NlpD
LKSNDGKPTYLIGDAKCVYADDLGQGFGNTAIFRLRTPDGSDYLIRYLHLEDFSVNKGGIYSKDQIVGKIGKTGGVCSRRLYFDIAPISTYERIGSPDFEFNYWPSTTLPKHYIQEQFVDPQVFLSQYPESAVVDMEQREYSK